MDQEPNWANVLETLYESQLKEIKSRDDPHDTTAVSRDELDGELDLTLHEIKESLDYMETAGLLQLTDTVHDIYVLTPKGFQVAHERRMQKRRDDREDQRLERQQEFEENRVDHQEAREDERAKRQHEVNRAVAFLTLGLMTVTVIGATIRIFVAQQSYTAAYSTIIVGLILIVASAAILHYFGLLSSLNKTALSESGGNISTE
jgi:F0F1-type ATP synthase assembly protein I